MTVLKQAECGIAIADLCRDREISNATFFRWFGGMDASMITEMKTIQDENRRLKKIFAVRALDAEGGARKKNNSAISILLSVSHAM